MKTFLLMSLFFIAACDAPSGQRRQIFTTPRDGNAVVVPTPNSNGGGSPLTPVPLPTTPTTVTPGFETCDLTAKYSTTTIGQVGICQSTSDETQVKFKTSLTDTAGRTCLIPTYKDSTGSSTYLGQPQCTYTEAGKEYFGRLYKSRVGFEMYQLNGVMVMKEALLVSYFSCMNSVQFYQQNRNCTYEADYRSCIQQMGMYAQQTCCQRQITNYQTLVCNAFKTNFNGQYLDLRLKL